MPSLGGTRDADEDDLFVNDDLDNSAENRLNHVLFGLFLKDEYRSEVLRRLGVSEEAIIYKPSSRPWGRPDFAIESLNGETLGYIEVELDQGPGPTGRLPGQCGSPRLQLRTRGGRPRHHIVGTGGDGESGYGELGGGTGPAGQALWADNGRDGISVRVFSQKASGRTVGLFHITAGRLEVRFASYGHLAKYLPGRSAAIEQWADFVEQEFGGDIRVIGDRRSCPVELSVVEDNVDALLEAVASLK